MHIEEDDFLARAIVIFGANDVLAAIVQFHAIDDKVVVVAGIAFHEFHTLTQFLIVVRPCECWRRDADDATIEFNALSFVAEL